MLTDSEWRDRIRSGLQDAAKGRAKADEQFVLATRNLEYWLRRAKDDEEMSMTEAARLAGVSRKTAYAMAEAAIDQAAPEETTAHH